MDRSPGDDGAAVLVGVIIRSYRYDLRNNGRRLSQDGFLDLMVKQGEEYAVDLDRSTLSRWETGKNMAPREFLEALGRTCEIPQDVMDRLMNLAGYDGPVEERQGDAILSVARDIETRVADVQLDVRSLKDSSAGPEPVSDAFAVAKSTLRRAALPGVFALMVGFVLNAMGLNGTLVLLVYVLGVLALVLGQGVLRWVKRDRNLSERDHVVDLFYISLFFTMNVSLLISVLTKSDHFGFHTFGAFTNTPVSFLLTMLAHLALSLAGAVVFSVSWSHQLGPSGSRNAFSRALWTVLPPLLFVYVNLVVFTNLGNWIHFTYIFGILFVAFAAIVALNEPGMVLRDGGFVLKAAVVATILLGALGIIGTLAGYLDPRLVITAEEFRIIPLREVSSEELGYSDAESSARWRLGILWMSFATIVYIVTMVGGYLMMTISRVTSADDHAGEPHELHQPEMSRHLG